MALPISTNISHFTTMFKSSRASMDRSTVQQQHGHSTHGTTSAHSTRAAAAAAAAGSTLPTTHTRTQQQDVHTVQRWIGRWLGRWFAFLRVSCCCNSASICLEWVSGRLRWVFCRTGTGRMTVSHVFCCEVAASEQGPTQEPTHTEDRTHGFLMQKPVLESEKRLAAIAGSPSTRRT